MILSVYFVGLCVSVFFNYCWLFSFKVIWLHSCFGACAI